MILYNYRYRGPYEYDKFVINTLQLSNTAYYLEKQFRENQYKYITEFDEKAKAYLSEITGVDSRLHELMLISEQLI